jgi:bifunctional non-homologous end joining protein LigD
MAEGRPLTEPLAGLPDDARARLVAAPAPARPEAMVATLTDARFSDSDWMFERKLDGERCLAWVEGGAVRLRSRNDLVLDDTYPGLVDALAQRTDADRVVDGEVVAFERGRTSFARLQKRLGVRSAAEALRASTSDGRLLLPLRRVVVRRLRHAGARPAFAQGGAAPGRRFRRPAALQRPPELLGRGLLRLRLPHGWEGLIAKRASSAYVGVAAATG